MSPRAYSAIGGAGRGQGAVGGGADCDKGSTGALTWRALKRGSGSHLGLRPLRGIRVRNPPHARFSVPGPPSSLTWSVPYRSVSPVL